MVKMKILVCLPLLLLCLGLLDHGLSGVGSDKVSVMERDSVTLNTGVQTNQQDRIRWYYNDIRIAQINRDQSKICTDVQCNNGTERFRDRLKLDHQTGSLTIMNTRVTDAGDYKLLISSGSSESDKIFVVSVHGLSGVGSDKVSVMEGDSVTLYTGVQTNQQDRIRWYYNDIRIAQINRDQSKICTDVQCKDSDERFRDRLKLDHQTGSLTIMNITDTDAGDYKLLISSGSSESEEIFSVSVTGVSAAGRDKMKRKSVMEGESVILYPGVIRKLNDSITWYINDTRIAEITGDQSKICTAVQCKERFRDRLKLDHQTGSLNITNIRNTDSGEYKLQISNSRFSILKTFSVTVTALPDSGPSSTVRARKRVAAIIGISAAVVLVMAAVIYYCYRSKQKESWTPNNNNHQSARYRAVPNSQTGDPDPQTGDPDPQTGDPGDPDHQTGDLDQTKTSNTDTEEDEVTEETALFHTDSPQEGVVNESHNKTETALMS